MANVIHLESIAEMLQLLPGASLKHPLLALVDFSKHHEAFSSSTKITLGFYAVMFKNHCSNALKYGQKPYDFKGGSLVCMAPRQLISLDEPVESPEEIKGWALFFHPDIIRGTALGKQIKDYTFFNYEVNEALHLSDKERNVLLELVQKLEIELSENIDRHSQSIMVSTVELILNYCKRFYDRQFICRKVANSDMLSRVDEVLIDYFKTNSIKDKGLPTVKYLADRLALSPNYLSDLLKKETGMNAQERIHYFLIEEAKTLLLGSNQTVGELAFSLGFEYPQYFSRLFKAKTGMSPLEYRNLN